MGNLLDARIVRSNSDTTAAKTLLESPHALRNAVTPSRSRANSATMGTKLAVRRTACLTKTTSA